jgi:hypothetical protein
MLGHNEKLEVILYDEETIPALLTTLPFIHAWRAWFAPVDEDIAKFRPFVTGERSINDSRDPAVIVVAMQLPDLDEIEEKMRRNTFKSTATLNITTYGWHAYDVARVLREKEDESELDRQCRDEDFTRDFLKLKEADGLDFERIRELGVPTSVIPFIKAWEKLDSTQHRNDPRYFRHDNFYLSPAEERAIRAREEVLFAELGLRKVRKGYRLTRRTHSGNRSPNLAPGAKDDIVRRDGYRCFFTGETPPQTTLDVHHIISRYLIDKLDLPPSLYTEAFNLITVGSSTNRAKKAKLFKEDIHLYFQRIRRPDHANYRILYYLQRIREIQNKK